MRHLAAVKPRGQDCASQSGRSFTPAGIKQGFNQRPSGFNPEQLLLPLQVDGCHNSGAPEGSDEAPKRVMVLAG